MCTSDTDKTDIEILDDELDVVGEAEILCETVKDELPPPATGDDDCYSVTGKTDVMRDDMDLHATNSARTVSSAPGAQGIFPPSRHRGIGHPQSPRRDRPGHHSGAG